MCNISMVIHHADPEDVLPSLYMGVTMNHIAAVIVPVAGGLIWNSVGYTITFVAGAAVVLVSLFAASRIRSNKIMQDERQMKT